MGIINSTMAKQSNFGDQSLESTDYNSDSDPDYDPREFFVRNAKNLPRRRSIKPVNSTSKRVSKLPMLETLIEIGEASSQILQSDEDNQVMNSVNESLHEISDTHYVLLLESDNMNNLYSQNTQADDSNSSRISLDVPSLPSGFNISENNAENHNENSPENQEIKKTINLNINVPNAGNNIITQQFSFEISMDDKVENLNISLKPIIEPAKQETDQPIPSTSNVKKKVTIIDNSTSDSDGKKSKKKKSKGKKKYSKKRSKHYSSDSDCSCSDCFYTSYSSYSSSSDECCRKHCKSCYRKDVKEKPSKKY